MIVDVALPIPAAKTFSYTVPDRWKPFVEPFMRLKVPFHNRIHTGVVITVGQGDDPGLKEILEIIDFFPLVDETLAALCNWSSRYYVTPIGLVLKYALPPTLNVEPHVMLRAHDHETLHLNGLTLTKAVKLCGREALFRLRQRGSISLHDVFTGESFLPVSGTSTDDHTQQNRLFIGDVRSRLNHYLESISSAIDNQSNVLMLLPDHYAAGTYFKRALTERFGDRVLWYGSGTTARSRMETFHRARTQGGRVVLGNKSCVFLPMRGQSLVIIEREEEDEYRNEQGFKFNAGTLALKRAALGRIPVIVGSASPSLDTYRYAEYNGFQMVKNKWLLDPESREKITVAGLTSSAAFLEELVPVIKAGLIENQRIAVFTPRKDYGSSLMCHDCKKPLLCPDCQGVLGYEKEAGRLTCSLCGKSFSYEEECSHCGGTIIRFLRVGAEYVAEKLTDYFPDAAILKITGDSLKREMRRLKKSPAQSPLILVGTQSLSKLYEFHVQQLVLLGWEDLRKMGGYRSDEKMVQTLINLLDALTPEKILFFMERKHRMDMDLFMDMEGLYRQALGKRQEADFPPYRRAFLVEIDKKGKDRGDKTIKRIRDILHEEGLFENSESMPVLEKSMAQKWRLVLRGELEPLSRALLKVYGLPHVQIEADPPHI